MVLHFILLTSYGIASDIQAILATSMAQQRAPPRTLSQRSRETLWPTQITWISKSQSESNKASCKIYLNDTMGLREMLQFVRARLKILAVLTKVLLPSFNDGSSESDGSEGKFNKTIRKRKKLIGGTYRVLFVFKLDFQMLSFNIFRSFEIGERFLDTQCREAGCSVGVPTFFHKLRHYTQSFVRLPTIRHARSLAIQADHLAHLLDRRVGRNHVVVGKLILVEQTYRRNDKIILLNLISNHFSLIPFKF